MKNIMNKHLIKFFTLFCIIFVLFLYILPPISSFAASEEELAEMEIRKELPIQSNKVFNWPAGPAIGADGSILIEANSNTILYSKNQNKRLYPASTTKILTSILIMENCELDEIITFSKDAIDSISWNDSNMGASVGDQITVDQALHAILIGSANEAAYAMAEYISGDIETFSDLMNAKAQELGCKNSHFTNPSGLHNDEHYTTAYDLSLIAKEFFKYDFLCTLSSTYSYEISSYDIETKPTLLYTKNKLLSNREYSYPNLVGSKTGYTDVARQTLVSCAQKDGMSLICVILKEEAPFQFEDTITLFNYGFSNFVNIPIAENETNYQFSFSAPFQCDYSIFGNSAPLVSYDKEYYVTIPASTAFYSLQSEISFNSTSNIDDASTSSDLLAYINYYYNDLSVGFIPIQIEEPFTQFFSPANTLFIEDINPIIENNNVYYLQLKIVFLGIATIFIPIILLCYLRNIFFNSSKSKHKRGLRKRRKSSSPFKFYKF